LGRGLGWGTPEGPANPPPFWDSVNAELWWNCSWERRGASSPVAVSCTRTPQASRSGAEAAMWPDPPWLPASLRQRRPGSRSLGPHGPVRGTRRAPQPRAPITRRAGDESCVRGAGWCEQRGPARGWRPPSCRDGQALCRGAPPALGWGDEAGTPPDSRHPGAERRGEGQRLRRGQMFPVATRAAGRSLSEGWEGPLCRAPALWGCGCPARGSDARGFRGRVESRGSRAAAGRLGASLRGLLYICLVPAQTPDRVRTAWTPCVVLPEASGLWSCVSGDTGVRFLSGIVPIGCGGVQRYAAVRSDGESAPGGTRGSPRCSN